MYATSGSKDTTHKFTGQILDDNTNLYYYNARYYDPVLCMFITADPKLLWLKFDVESLKEKENESMGYIKDPQKWNAYAYCRNNPIIYTDPTGESWLSDWLDQSSWGKDVNKFYDQNKNVINTVALIVATGGAASLLSGTGALGNILSVGLTCAQIGAEVGAGAGAIGAILAGRTGDEGIGAAMWFGARIGAVTGIAVATYAAVRGTGQRVATGDFIGAATDFKMEISAIAASVTTAFSYGCTLNETFAYAYGITAGLMVYNQMNWLYSPGI